MRRALAPGERLLSQGERSDEVFLLAAGRVAVSINLAEGRRYRVATLPAGVAVGELAARLRRANAEIAALAT